MKIRVVGENVTRGTGSLTAALILVVSLWAAPAQSQTIVGNSAGFGGGPIDSFDFATGALLNSFVPAGALVGNSNGRGLLVLGNNVYYTELNPCCFGPTDSIRVAPYNGGAGGADTRTIPNPRPGDGVQDLSYANGLIYALTGYITDTPEVFALSPVTGAVVSGPVSIASPAGPFSDGFVVLPNGNFLISSSDAPCTYNQFDPSTGALIPATTITVAGLACSGVDTDGTHLFFMVTVVGPEFDSITMTDLTGGSAVTQSVPPNLVEDISLVKLGTFAGLGGTPGTSSCYGKVVAYLSKTFGTLGYAGIALGIQPTGTLARAIKGFCL